MERRIEIVIAAQDDYSAALNKFNAAMGNVEGATLRMGRGLDTAAAGTDKVGRQFNKLTSATEYAASGLKKINNIISGMAFGAVIGAVSAVTQTLINHYKETIVTEEQVARLNTAVTSQAGAWKLLPEPMSAVTAETVNLYNAQLKYLQLLESDKGAGLERQIRDLELMRRNAEINLRAQPGRADHFEKAMSKYNVKIAEARIELERWRSVMALTPMTVEGVISSVAEATEKLKLPEGGGSLSAFILGDLSSPEIGERIRLKFGGIIGAAMDEAATVVKDKDPFAIGELDFSMAYVRRTEDYAAYIADYLRMTEEKYMAETAYEEALLDRSAAYGEQKYQIAAQVEQQILNLKFSAANHAIALFSILGQKNKAAATAALVLQKGLAMAQVWIQTITAATGAKAALAMIPIVGPALAEAEYARIMLMGKINLGLIAATGIAELAMGGGGGASGTATPALSGGSTDAYPVPTSTEERSVQNITLNIYNPLADENWQKIVEDNIIPAINDAANRDINIEVNTY